MVSSAGGPIAAGAGDSVCASRPCPPALRNKKTAAVRNFTSASVLATPESTSRNLMAFEKPVNFLRQLRPDPFGRRDLFHGRFSQSVYRTKFSQEQILAVLTHTGAIVENTFTDPLFHQQLVIRVREPVRFVANALE